MIHCTHQAPTYFTYLNVAVFDFETDSNPNGSSNAARKVLQLCPFRTFVRRQKETFEGVSRLSLVVLSLGCKLVTQQINLSDTHNL